PSHVRVDLYAAVAQDVLQRSVSRETLDRCSQLADSLGRTAAPAPYRLEHELREGCGERRHGADGAGAEPLVDERLRADEHVEAFDQVRLEAFPRRVRHLHP